MSINNGDNDNGGESITCASLSNVSLSKIVLLLLESHSSVSYVKEIAIIN